MTYLWLKAGHIIFVIFWMAGLFMLPRLFVYHQECAPNSLENALWIDRERKLLKIILWPAMVLVWIFGLSLALTIGAFAQPWFHLKLAAVLGLTFYHVWLARYAQGLGHGERRLDRQDTAPAERNSGRGGGGDRGAGRGQAVLKVRFSE